MSYDLPDFDEASTSQIPALLELVNLGYTYLSRSEVSSLRENKSQYVLRDIAFKALRKINGGNISDKSIHDVVFEAETQIDMGAGAYKASKEIFSLMLAGRSVSELVNGRRVSPQLRFIDYSDPLNNTFHVCAEFELSEGSDRRPDIVLFVNGFPFAVIENKKASVKVDDAVAQMAHNQRPDQTPKFFLFPQILVATNVRELKYGTMLTPPRFYAHWKEKGADLKELDAQVSAIINKPVNKNVVDQIARDLLRSDYKQVGNGERGDSHEKHKERQLYHEGHEENEEWGLGNDGYSEQDNSPFIIQNSPFSAKPRKVTEQDRGIFCLLRPERLLDLTRNFILYDNNIKKIARYPQYFAVKKSLERLKNIDENGKRRGGLIWHTQGSGKSLTMVMLVKCLIEDPDVVLPRVVVVTDRRDLDKQISDTFAACNIKKGVIRTRRAKELVELIKNKDQRVITSLIHKFDAARKMGGFVDNDPNIFVFIDEAHRSQAGKANLELNLILPNACQIGFTGTPLMKREKSSARKFGGMIDAYTISEAEEDGVVLPLVYQPRFVEQQVQQTLLDRFYDQITRDLTEAQKKDLQNKFNSSQIVEETSQRIETIALDILEHFSRFVDTGLKAQVVAPSKYAAIMFQKAFELQKRVQTEVIVSDTADREEDDKLPEHKRMVAQWFREEKHKHGTSLETREKNLIRDFKENPEGVRILIVVDKLLTGFDAPRNTFLYLAKQLKDHNLLQAIARVNRLFEGDEGREAKVNGFVIDYSKNARNLYDAMQLFSNYDPQDVARALLNTDDKVVELERVYQELHDIFKTVKSKQDTEEYIHVLEEDTETRERFYELVNDFVKQFSTCLMLYDFTKKFDASKLRRYQRDLKKFVELKKIQKTKHAESVDFSKYEEQIRRILDKYVSSEYVLELTEPLEIRESGAFNEYISSTERGLSDKSKAEAIAARTKRVIKENFHRDPEFYRRFSEKIEKLIEELKAARMEDLRVLLEQAREFQDSVDGYKAHDIPDSIREEKVYHPFFRALQAKLDNHPVTEAQICEMVRAMYDIIEQYKIVDWHRNIEAERRVRMELEDYLFDTVKAEFGIPLSVEEIDDLVSRVWKLAVENREDSP